MKFKNLKSLGLPTLFLGILTFLEFMGNQLLSPRLLGKFHPFFEEHYIYVLEISIWLVGARCFQSALRIFFWDRLAQKSSRGEVPKLLVDLSSVCIYIIAITGILGQVFKYSLTGFWTTSSVFGLILGFALRNMILDIFTGLAVNLEQPYQIGDWIQVHQGGQAVNTIGQVVEINWRSTRIQTESNHMIVIPNSLLTTFVVTNFCNSGFETRYETTFCLDFSVPPGRVRRILMAGVKSVMHEPGFVADREPEVLLGDTNSMGIEYRVRYWIRPWNGTTPSRAKDRVVFRIMDHITQAGLTLAYPKQDLYMARMPIRQLDTRTKGDRSGLLSKLSLFEGMQTDELVLLADRMERKFFYKGEDLIQIGETGESMFVLVEGLLDVCADINGNGKMVKVSTLQPGEYFGEMSMLTGAPRSATIVAVTDAICYEITKNHMRVLFENRPEMVKKISDTIAKRNIQNEIKKNDWTSKEQLKQTDNMSSSIMARILEFFRFSSTLQK